MNGGSLGKYTLKRLIGTKQDNIANGRCFSPSAMLKPPKYYGIEMNLDLSDDWVFPQWFEELDMEAPEYT